MKYSTFILVFVFSVGCSTPLPREASTEELRVLEIARRAVADHDGRFWARDAEYHVVRHGSEWIVGAVRPTRHLFGPPTYQIGCDRMISIDEHGTVTSYLYGM